MKFFTFDSLSQSLDQILILETVNMEQISTDYFHKHKMYSIIQKLVPNLTLVVALQEHKKFPL